MAASTYDDIAEWYDTWLGSAPLSEDPFFQEVETLMGDIAGSRVCDLGCGQGRVARHLADQGAQVLGIDLSAKLLAIAARHEAVTPRGIAYLRADAGHLDGVVDGVVDGAFDGVVCHMALMDMPHLAPVLREVTRILRPGGWFIFSILHPCFNTSRSGEELRPEGWTRHISGYFDEGFWRSQTSTGPPGKVGAYHRTLSTYVTALHDAGLTLELGREPRFTGNHAALRPIWAEVPAVLIARCRSGSPGDER